MLFRPYLTSCDNQLQGWELIEEVVLDFESQMKEAVNEEHEGKRKCELTWKVHRIHWEKNRFIFDLMYKRKVMSRELVSRSSVNHFNNPLLSKVQLDLL